MRLHNYGNNVVQNNDLSFTSIRACLTPPPASLWVPTPGPHRSSLPCLPICRFRQIGPTIIEIDVTLGRPPGLEAEVSVARIATYRKSTIKDSATNVEISGYGDISLSLTSLPLHPSLPLTLSPLSLIDLSLSLLFTPLPFTPLPLSLSPLSLSPFHPHSPSPPQPLSPPLTSVSLSPLPSPLSLPVSFSMFVYFNFH